jgi:hypothetical protein
LLFKFSNNPEVNAIHESFCLHHVANAFIHGSFIIAIFGIGSHLEIHKFSTILYTSGLSFLVIAFAHDNQNIISFCIRKDTIHQIPRPIRTKGKTPNVAFNPSSHDHVSVKNQVNITQKIRNKTAGKRINKKTVFL